MTTTNSQNQLSNLLDEMDRRIVQEIEWAKKGLDDAEFTKGQADMAKEIRERLITIYHLMNNDFTSLHEQLGID